MELTLNFTLTDFITEMSNNTGKQITFNDLKEEFSRKDDVGNNLYNINIKTYDDLAIIYSNDTNINSEKDQKIKLLEQSCKSCVIEKNNLQLIASQFNRMIYNDQAKTILQQFDWNRVLIQKCYEGTLLLVFNYNNTWYVSTRRCLRAEDSIWVKNKSYRTMFDEAMVGKFTFDELNKDYCYHFVLVHYKNRNIVNYTLSLGKDYKELYHIMTTKKYTLDEVDYKINDNVKTCPTENFENLDRVLEKLHEIDCNNRQLQKITEEGYIIRAYNGEVKNSSFITFKLQTDIYQYLVKLKPNTNNINQGYLELYQKDKLVEYLPYFTKYSNDIIKRINTAMKTISKEILDIYHCTRQKKNPHIYNLLPDMYKKILYGLHGIYINKKKEDYSTSLQNNTSHHIENNSKSVNVHDIYYYLKTIPSYELRQIFYERMSLLEKNNVVFINKNCIYTMTQSVLMFKK